MRVTIYSKPGCHLCDDMKLLVHRVITTHPNAHTIALDEIDISTDAALLDLHGLEIPVLMIDGKKVAKYRVSEDELRRMLTGRRG